ncbi:MAG: gamma-glutamyl-gamma-aminobutyrate hydrolase family protein [Nitrosomonas sp.]|nr:gamma-glutamyl-gamma-aminobutyrate hydrolase family protein [Nitrosomonas sp.]
MEFSEGGGRQKQVIKLRARSCCRVAVLDFGVKRAILRKLVETSGCHVTVYPAQTRIDEILPPGLMVCCFPMVLEIRFVIMQSIWHVHYHASKIPVFGICLGHQIIALAIGARTIKMKFGHHGANHPVLDVDSGRVMITSQNHGFAVDVDTLPANVRVTHHSLFDGSLQGFELTDHPVLCFQGHPEASPGPQDVNYLFSRFISRMVENKQSA